MHTELLMDNDKYDWFNLVFIWRTFDVTVCKTVNKWVSPGSPSEISITKTINIPSTKSQGDQDSKINHR